MSETRGCQKNLQIERKKFRSGADKPGKPKLLYQFREALRSRHYSRRTEQTYCQWVKRFIYFHKMRHLAEMGESEINAFLTHLAVREKISSSTQTQALSALLFLYRHVLGREIGDLGEVIRAQEAKAVASGNDKVGSKKCFIKSQGG